MEPERTSAQFPDSEACDRLLETLTDPQRFGRPLDVDAEHLERCSACRELMRAMSIVGPSLSEAIETLRPGPGRPSSERDRADRPWAQPVSPMARADAFEAAVEETRRSEAGDRLRLGLVSPWGLALSLGLALGIGLLVPFALANKGPTLALKEGPWQDVVAPPLDARGVRYLGQLVEASACAEAGSPAHGRYDCCQDCHATDVSHEVIGGGTARVHALVHGRTCVRCHRDLHRQVQEPGLPEACRDLACGTCHRLPRPEPAFCPPVRCQDCHELEPVRPVQG